MLKTLSKIFRK